MRKLILVVVMFIVITVMWFAVWHHLLADDKAQIEATLAHHYRAIKSVTPSATLKADDIYRTGFPFHFRIAVHRPTLTQIWGGETYAISFEKILFEKVNSGEGRYRAILPATFEALYAKDGQAPEQYTITADPMPAVLVRATANSRQCSNLPGAPRCAATVNDPLISFAAQLPNKLILDLDLEGQSKKISFDFMPINIPLFMTIPPDASRPLQVFIGMLREAMVFSKP